MTAVDTEDLIPETAQGHHTNLSTIGIRKDIRKQIGKSFGGTVHVSEKDIAEIITAGL